jgi:nickel-dependent lactate racemase
MLRSLRLIYDKGRDLVKMNSLNKEVRLPFGSKSLRINLPTGYKTLIIENHDLPPVDDFTQAVRQAVLHPIGTPRIVDMVCPGAHVVIVINDHTRPAFGKVMVQEIIKELALAGVPDGQVTILVATGTHRGSTQEELIHMLGSDTLKRFRVMNHDCRDTDNLVRIGETPNGTPITINRFYVEADFRILTGVIAPHHAAGFSGGRKSVIPGLAGLDVLRRHHALGIRSYDPAMGRLEDNLFHTEAVTGAKMAGVNFIVNVVPNGKGEAAAVVAGDLEAAHMEGVKICRMMCRCPIPFRADIVITSPGGYPRDINLYQAQKAVSVAENIVKDGGVIILVAECSDGAGSEEFVNWMTSASSPQEIIERFRWEGFVPGSNKAFMFARALSRTRIIVVTDKLSREFLAKMFMEKAFSIGEALALAGKPKDFKPVIAVIPIAAYVIPEVCDNA